MIWNALDVITDLAGLWAIITVGTLIAGEYFGWECVTRNSLIIGTAVYGAVITVAVLGANLSVVGAALFVVLAALGIVSGYGVTLFIRYITDRL